MGFMPDLKGITAKLDERFAVLIQRLDAVIAELQGMRSDLRTRSEGE